jgi:hypothetical protein
MSRKRLEEEMDAGEVLSWMAYEMSLETERREKYIKEIELERAEAQSNEERAKAMKAILMTGSRK